MSTYAIGDVQGCFDELQALLQRIEFNPDIDTLWFCGDLVNRGPKSLEVLRYIKSLGNRALVVLGNHDFYLMVRSVTFHQQAKDDTLTTVLTAPDSKDLITWLRHQPLLHHDPKLNYTLTHAGIYPRWNLPDAKRYAKEVEEALQSTHYHNFLLHLYGNQPDRWQETLTSWARLRFITNAFTRMRLCRHDGSLVLDIKRPPSALDSEYIPWFQFPNRPSTGPQLFGHWAALNGETRVPEVVGLDTGCVWGKALTAQRLEDNMRFSVPALRHYCELP